MLFIMKDAKDADFAAMSARSFPRRKILLGAQKILMLPSQVAVVFFILLMVLQLKFQGLRIAFLSFKLPVVVTASRLILRA